MPTYMDIHDLPGVTAADVAKAHLHDQYVQSKHGVEYVKYWLNESNGKLFCLCTAPNAEAARAVHREAHGLEASHIMEVMPDMADAFMGAAEIDRDGAVLLPDKHEHDPGTRTVLFTDIVGSTDLTQRLGDDAAMIMVKAHDDVVRAALAANSGREIKHTGDGIMAAFLSALSAIRCAMAVRQAFCDHCTSNPGMPIKVRIGIASGEPVEHHNDLFGATVQLAARLCAHAEPEQILISNAVAELCVGKPLPLQKIGAIKLKGFEQLIDAHAVGAY